VIFPAIKILVNARRQNIILNSNEVSNITTLLKDMEADHEAAGGLLREMRSVTNNYTLPPDACNSFFLLYHKLIALEEDLHQHIHLENNILFKKATLLEQELLKLAS
jgi:regulator of cell morphogenesis and NO signaling